MVKPVFNWPEIGNDQVINFLSRSLENDKIAQTYLFIGSDDLGKSTVALAFARNLQGSPTGFNSDLHILEPEEGKKSISIEQVRELIKILSLSSFLNSYKIGIIKEAELLTLEAQSALLKTLEEPQEKVVLILLASSEDSLPKTILSRSQILYFYPVPAPVIYDYLIKNYGANRSLAKDLANLSLGRPLKALHLLENPEIYKEHLRRAEILLSSLEAANLNDRLSDLDKVFSDKTYSRQAVSGASELISILEGLLRDLLLLSLGQTDRLQYSVIIESLRQTLAFWDKKTDNESIPLILEKLKSLALARAYLGGNVNPRLVLEQLMINL